MKLFFRLLRCIIFSVFVINSFSQDKLEVNLSADLVNRYIWRGFDVGKAPNIQPLLTFNYKNLEVGFWGTYALTDEATKFDELNLWFIYKNKLTKDISYKISIIDYYFPNDGIKLGNIKNFNLADSTIGGHLINIGATLTGPESFPLSFNFNINAYNDAGYNNYFELSYPFNVNNIELLAFVGATTGSKENYIYYETDNFSIINVGIKATKAIKISDEYSIPAFIGVSINPRSENAFIHFGITL